MSTVLMFFIPAIIVLMITLPVIPFIRKTVTGQKAKYALFCNLGAFFGICALAVILPISDMVGFAATSPEVTSAVVADVVSVGTGLGYIGAAIAVGLSSLGAGIAVASAAPAAIGAVSEDPKALGKSLIFVALGEGVALYGLLIAFMIVSNL